MPGPPPKRTERRRRANKPEVPVEVAQAGAEVARPEPDPEWHPIAHGWYESLARSGQSVFYEESDWLTAFAVAESMSREFKPQPIVGKDGEVQWVKMPPKAASLAAWLKAGSSLLVTEGDRRRLRLELVRSQSTEEAPDVAWIDDARTRLRSG